MLSPIEKASSLQEAGLIDWFLAKRTPDISKPHEGSWISGSRMINLAEVGGLLNSNFEPFSRKP